PGVTIEAGAAATTSNRDGTYALEVRPGMYDVAFRLSEFATAIKHEVISADQLLDVTLYLSSTAEIVVNARPTPNESASVGVIASQQIEQRPLSRPGEILETVPGMVITQHSGEGKANQYYLRGFNLDHGTDVA